jgi:periplasmic protein TonB
MTGVGIRWIVCASLVALAHGWVWLALTKPNLVVDSDAGSPVVQLELSPVSAAPPQSPDAPQSGAPTLEPSAEAPPSSPVPIPPQVSNKPGSPPSPDPAPPQAASDRNPLPPTPMSTRDIVSAPPPPQPTLTPAPRTPTTVDLPPQPASASAPSAAASAETTAAPSAPPGREEEAISPAAVKTWQRELIAQIERHKHFPTSGKGRSGVVTVAFSINRDGGLTQVRVVASSGSTALDQAAVDLIRQSQPFPRPPGALAGNDLSFAAPIRYLPSGAH